MAYVHEHLLRATRGDQPLWDFVAGGRISSPPVIYRDLALFGCHDGYVYAVKLSDGSLVWRFLAAPADRRHVVFGQFESAWPVFNVALDKGKAYFAAGRHGDLDGGIHVYCVDPVSGTLQWHAKYLRGLTTDKNTRFNFAPEGHEGKIGKNKERWNSYVINDPIEVRNGKIYIRAEFPDPGWDAEKGTRLPEEHLARLEFPYERVQAGKQPGLLRYPEGELTLIDDIDDPHDTIINSETLAPPRPPGT